MPPQSYRIVVDGRLRHRFAEGFDNMTQGQEHSNTVLSGDVVDQAALAGLLDRIRGLGITITSFAVVDDPAGSDQVNGRCGPESPTGHERDKTTRKGPTWTTP